MAPPSKTQPIPNLTASLSAPDIAAAARSIKAIHHRGIHDSGIIGSHGANSMYVPQAMWTEGVESTMKLGNRTDVWDPIRFLKEEEARTKSRDRRRHYLMSQRATQYDALSKARGDEDAANKEAIATMTKNLAQDQDREKDKTDKIKENKRIFREGLDQQKRDIAQRERDQRQEEAKENAEMKLRSYQQLALEMKQHEEHRKSLSDLARHHQMSAQARRQGEHDEKMGGRDDVNQTIRKLKAAEDIKNDTKRKALEAKQKEMQACADMYMRTAGKAELDRNTFYENRADNDAQHMMRKLDEHYSEREQARSRQKQNMLQTLREQTNHNEEMARTAKSDDLKLGQAIMEGYRTYVEEEKQKVLDRKAKLRKAHAENLVMIAERQKAQQLVEGASSVRPNPAISTMRPGSGGTVEMMKRIDASRFLDKPLGRTTMRATSQPALDVGTSRIIEAAAPAPRCLLSATLLTQDNHLKARWFDNVSPQQLRAGRAVARQRKKAAAMQRADVLQ
jgi:hypothetical protein